MELGLASVEEGVPGGPPQPLSAAFKADFVKEAGCRSEPGPGAPGARDSGEGGPRNRPLSQTSPPSGSEASQPWAHSVPLPRRQAQGRPPAASPDPGRSWGFLLPPSSSGALSLSAALPRAPGRGAPEKSPAGKGTRRGTGSTWLPPGTWGQCGGKQSHRMRVRAEPLRMGVRTDGELPWAPPATPRPARAPDPPGEVRLPERGGKPCRQAWARCGEGPLYLGAPWF